MNHLEFYTLSSNKADNIATSIQEKAQNIQTLIASVIQIPEKLNTDKSG
jgi:hypothetical protein